MANLQAFLDGLTGAGLFGKLRWPGAPTELIGSRTAANLDCEPVGSWAEAPGRAARSSEALASLRAKETHG